ncbi:MAG: ROK family protein [Caldilineaceae bacterium]|nr:ROK family protein [Caldilineaceae bacterium]
MSRCSGEKIVNILGIDIGGSGIKGAIVDVSSGEILTDRHRIDTPAPSTPAAVGQVVAELAQHFEYQGPIGCTFPAVVQHGVILTAANVDQSWIGTNGEAVFQEATGLPVHVLNDADAAGVAEMRFGAGRGRKGVVIMLTFGTGIGSAIFINGQLLPNTEFGHMKIRGKDAEHRAAARIRTEKDLNWKQWAKRVDEFLREMEFLFSPDLFIIGGGVSKKFDKFVPHLTVRAELQPAQLLNEAGIVGAAMAASEIFPTAKAETPKAETPKAEASETETPAAEAPKVETPRKRGPKRKVTPAS